MRYLVTGGCGFLGSNLAAGVLARGDELQVFDNLSRLGSERNLQWLRRQGEFEFRHGDLRNAGDLRAAITGFRPEVIFHVAGQVAMTTSLARPDLDFEINALGTLQLLELARRELADPVVLFSSTNKVYGDLESVRYREEPTRYRDLDHPDGLPESRPLDFRTPYGCSKGCADRYLADYHRSFGLRTVVFRHSSIYGGRQFSSYDQGWVGWFVAEALNRVADAASPIEISGNGKQVRDLLHARDLVALYFTAAERIDTIAGETFNIGGGMANSLSILELLAWLERRLGRELPRRHLPPRQSDQRVFVADIAKARARLGWAPAVGVDEGLERMVEWIAESRR